MNKTPIFSLVVAIIAIVVSQFQPIYTYFQKDNIELYMPSKLNISHHFGGLKITSYLQYRNAGSSPGTVFKTKLLLMKEDVPDFEQKLIAQAYKNPKNTFARNELVMPLISLKSNETWSGTVKFLEFPPIARQRKIAELSLKATKELDKPKNLKKIPTGRFLESKLSNGLYDEISSFTRKELEEFTIGNYILAFAYYTQKDESKPPSNIKLYKMTVFENDTRSLENLIKSYQHGVNITPFMTKMSGFEGFNALIKEYSNDILVSSIKNKFLKSSLATNNN